MDVFVPATNETFYEVPVTPELKIMLAAGVCKAVRKAITDKPTEFSVYQHEDEGVWIVRRRTYRGDMVASNELYSGEPDGLLKRFSDAPEHIWKAYKEMKSLGAGLPNCTPEQYAEAKTRALRRGEASKRQSTFGIPEQGSMRQS